jgi:hypothetical protein
MLNRVVTVTRNLGTAAVVAAVVKEFFIYDGMIYFLHFILLHIKSKIFFHSLFFYFLKLMLEIEQ